MILRKDANMFKVMITLIPWLKLIGITGNYASVIDFTLLFLLLLLVAYVGFKITWVIIDRSVKFFVKRTHTVYDDIILQHHVFGNLAHIVSAIIIIYGIRAITLNSTIINFMVALAYSYLIFEVMIVSFRFLDALNDIYEIYAEKKRIQIHIKQYVQVVKVLIAITAVIWVIAIFLNKNPASIIAGLGALTAVLLLVFKDSILSLVASIQISAYDLVKVGDWITIPGRGIDGDVIDVSLNTVKVRNFDNTISTVPTYALVQESFKNWRGMSTSGGRRIKRAIYIDMNSIQLCAPEMIKKFEKIHYISEYVKQRQKEIDGWNKEHNIQEPVRVNGRAQTNIGIFRKYVENYIRNNFKIYKKYHKEQFEIKGKIIEKFVVDDPSELTEMLGKRVSSYLQEIDGKTVIKDSEAFITDFSDFFVLENSYLYRIRKVKKNRIVKGAEVEVEESEKVVVKEGKFRDDMTLLIRQLDPTDKGLPIEIYVFTATTDWGEYENIQSDLFDHIFAVLPEFDLRVFQTPSSYDIQRFLEGKEEA